MDTSTFPGHSSDWIFGFFFGIRLGFWRLNTGFFWFFLRIGSLSGYSLDLDLRLLDFVGYLSDY
jgi:hypothetical protein